MATKKKAVKKTAVTRKAKKNLSEIYILADGPDVFPKTLPVDPAGMKHSGQVYWQAMDSGKYKIVLDTTPAPFKNVIFPIQTDDDGATQIVEVGNYSNGETYGYKVAKRIRGKFVIMSADSIIIDS